jgi:hypothetical protein
LLVEALLRYEATVAMPTVLAPTALVRELRFDEALPLAEDYDFAIRLAASAPGVVVDDPLIEIRLHDARTTILRGYVELYVGKALTFRKAAAGLNDPRARRLARRQHRAHVAQLTARAIRRGDVRPLLGALRRLANRSQPVAQMTDGPQKHGSTERDQ